MDVANFPAAAVEGGVVQPSTRHHATRRLVRRRSSITIDANSQAGHGEPFRTTHMSQELMARTRYDLILVPTGPAGILPTAIVCRFCDRFGSSRHYHEKCFAS
jgi:hypothetical protein